MGGQDDDDDDDDVMCLKDWPRSIGKSRNLGSMQEVHGETGKNSGRA